MLEAAVQIVAILAISFVGLTMLTLGKPLTIIDDWLAEREYTKRILAEARLQEAKNAARDGGADA